MSHISINLLTTNCVVMRTFSGSNGFLLMQTRQKPSHYPYRRLPHAQLLSSDILCICSAFCWWLRLGFAVLHINRQLSTAIEIKFESHFERWEDSRDAHEAHLEDSFQVRSVPAFPRSRVNAYLMPFNPSFYNMPFCTFFALFEIHKYK